MFQLDWYDLWNEGEVYKHWRRQVFSLLDIPNLVLLQRVNSLFHKEILDLFRELPMLKLQTDLKKLREIDPDFNYDQFVLGINGKGRGKIDDIKQFVIEYHNSRILPFVSEIKFNFSSGAYSELDTHHIRFSKLYKYEPEEIESIDGVSTVLNSRLIRALGCCRDPIFKENLLHAKLCLLSHIVGLAQTQPTLELAYIKRGINMCPTLGAFTQIQADSPSEIYEKWNPDVWTFYFLDTSHDSTYYSCGGVGREELPIYINRDIFFRPLPDHLKPSIYKDREFDCVDIQQTMHQYFGQPNLICRPFLCLHICIIFSCEEYAKKKSLTNKCEKKHRGENHYFNANKNIFVSSPTLL